MLVHLPIEPDSIGDDASYWLAQVRQWADSAGVPHLDLISTFRSVPSQERRTFFFGPGTPGMGHYTEVGHRWVAGQVHQALEKFR